MRRNELKYKQIFDILNNENVETSLSTVKELVNISPPPKKNSSPSR